MKSFGELHEEQVRREGDLLSCLMGKTEVEKLTSFEAELSERRGEALFKLAMDVEDTENALRQVEQLAQRLKKHLAQLKDLQRTLSK